MEHMSNRPPGESLEICQLRGLSWYFTYQKYSPNNSSFAYTPTPPFETKLLQPTVDTHIATCYMYIRILYISPLTFSTCLVCDRNSIRKCTCILNIFKTMKLANLGLKYIIPNIITNNILVFSETS